MWVCECHKNSLAPLFTDLERGCFAYAEFGVTCVATTPSPLQLNWRATRFRIVARATPRLRFAKSCHSVSLSARDALPFNPLMRNFKRNSSCYERIGRNFDRIELWRSPRRKDENSKRGRRRHADSVETLRTSKTSAFNRVLTHTYARSL